MKQEERSAHIESFAKYLEKCGLSGKTLIHYPNAVDRYLPSYIKKHINPNFEDFYTLNVNVLKNVYEQLTNSSYWELVITKKTWRLRIKALEYYIKYRESM